MLGEGRGRFVEGVGLHLQSIWDWVAPPPPRCLACGAPDEAARAPGVCRSCLERIVRLRPPLCAVCGKPLRALGATRATCSACSRGRYFSSARAYGLYGGLLRELIHRMKYGGETRLARPLANLMKLAWRDNRSLGPVDLIVPVPLAPSRLAQRGFNQSTLLADYLSRETGLPLVGDVLARRVETSQQSRTAGRDRYRNMRGAFVVTRQARCPGARVLLVDDVVTTGATADSCALALLDAGAYSVSVLAVANGHTGQDWLDP